MSGPVVFAPEVRVSFAELERQGIAFPFEASYRAWPAEGRCRGLVVSLGRTCLVFAAVGDFRALLAGRRFARWIEDGRPGPRPLGWRVISRAASFELSEVLGARVDA